MYRDPNIWATAGLMFAKFGHYAPEIAQRRAQQRSARNAHNAARRWKAIGEICRALVASAASRSVEKLNLESVLSEAEAQQLMEADEREHRALERMAQRTSTPNR